MNLAHRHIAAIVAYLMAAGGAIPQGRAAVEPTPVEKFKALLSSPPVIQRLVYAQTLPNAGRVAVSPETPLVGSTNREYYEVSWQADAMLHRRLTAPDQPQDSDNRAECVVLWKDQLYFLDARTKPSLYVLERKKAAQGIYPDPYHAAHIRLSTAAEPLNLGLNNLYPGTLRWDGDQFSVVSMGDKKPNSIRGRISRLSNGIPAELKVQYSNDMGQAQYRLQYDYASYRPPWYPSRIAAYFLEKDGGEYLAAEYAILEVTTASAPLPESHFKRARWFMPAASSWLYLTNDSVFGRLPSGQYFETPAAIPSVRLVPKDYYRNRYYYLAAAAWTIAFLAVAARTWKQAKHQSNQSGVVL